MRRNFHFGSSIFPEKSGCDSKWLEGINRSWVPVSVASSLSILLPPSHASSPACLTERYPEPLSNSFLRSKPVRFPKHALKLTPLLVILKHCWHPVLINQLKKCCLGRNSKVFWNKFLAIQLPRESPACLSGLLCLNLLLMTLWKSDLLGHRQPGCLEQLALLPHVIFFIFMLPGCPQQPSFPPQPRLTWSVESRSLQWIKQIFLDVAIIFQAPIRTYNIIGIIRRLYSCSANEALLWCRNSVVHSKNKTLKNYVSLKRSHLSRLYLALQRKVWGQRLVWISCFTRWVCNLSKFPELINSSSFYLGVKSGQTHTHIHTQTWACHTPGQASMRAKIYSWNLTPATKLSLSPYREAWTSGSGGGGIIFRITGFIYQVYIRTYLSYIPVFPHQ